MPGISTSGLGLEVFIILLLIVANGLFALTEMAVTTSRKSRLEAMAEDGDPGAKKALALSENPTDFLSAVQIGITLIGILTGAFGGAKLSGHLEGLVKEIPFLAPYSDVISLAVVVSIITYLSLILGELVPKRIALNSPEAIAAFVAGPVSGLVKIFNPLVKLLSVSTEFILSITRTKPLDEPPVTEEEVKVMIGQGTQHGVFEEAEREMVENIFVLSDMRVSSLMTPRTQIAWLDLDEELPDNLKLLLESKYSCFPVARGTLDDIVGVVYTKEILAQQVLGEAVELEKFAHDPVYVPRTTTALKVLELIKKEGTQIALVVDEFGGISGLITLNDILSYIVGEAAEPEDPADPDIVQREDGSWLLDGMLPLEEFKELFDLDELPGEERDYFHTLAGFVVSYFGYIPGVAEYFEWNGLRFEVLDMDRTRVDKILVSKVPEPPVDVDAIQSGLP